jgi:UDP-N-acetylglucosamine:LPS N-acetylglucosamine transferase
LGEKVKENKKICIAASAGGHLTEVMQLEVAWKNKPHFFISENKINACDLAKKEKVYFVKSANRNPFWAIVSFFQTAKIMLKENPQVVLSTGADTAFPALILGTILGKKVIYIESFCRIDSPSLTGKLIYPFVKDFYVQWEEGKKFFPKAKYVGAVFEK